ncbi:MAG: DUF1552 domain-containing protein [Vicinamibacterales bacterium]|nr:DUF1552 domain-containing protein [Vicinamibacterales bacterium]
MIITKKAIPRRSVLRGIGATLALPLLDGMVPALSAIRNTAASGMRRFGVVYVPNGMAMEHWTPTGEGTTFEFSPILQPMAPFRDRTLVLTGLNPGPGGGAHAGASTKFLTGVAGRMTDGAEIHSGTSIDQLLGKELGQYTQLSSLELALDGRDFAGSCDAGFSCAYTNTISWRTPTTPLPMENNPRVVFERLFGDSGSTDPAVRLARLKEDRSILDSVTEKVADLQQGIGPEDRHKIGQYLDAVRDVERRIQKAEEQSARELPLVQQPAGIPATFEEHMRLMFDLQLLAYQTDLTRVASFMVGREISGRTYNQIGIPDAHHPLSHHLDDPVKIGIMSKINTYHVVLFAEFVEKMRATPDGDGSLLDHSLLLYGAGMSNSNAHAPINLPIMLVGGAGGGLEGGRHITYPEDTPMANLLMAIMDALGVPMDQVGDSNGMLDVLSIA